jgi:hypothetical protein
MSLVASGKQYYAIYINSNANQLLGIGIQMYQQGYLDNRRSEFYSKQATEFGAGNATVAYNNPTDEMMNWVRVNTYSDSSLAPINDLARESRESQRHMMLIWAYLFFYKVTRIDQQQQQTNSVATQYIKDITSALSKSHVDILREGNKIFSDLGLLEWAQECNNMLSSSSEVHPSTIGSLQPPQQSNNPNELIDNALALFKIADSEANLSFKESKLNEAETYLQTALAALVGTHLAPDIIQKLTLIGLLHNHIRNQIIIRSL